jgi:hypothetical protein
LEKPQVVKKFILYILFFAPLLYGQKFELDETKLSGLVKEINKKKFITNNDGNVMMRINIWGHVASPGSYLVDAGIDIISLFSVVGGPLPGSNLSKIKLYREFPDSDGVSVHLIDMGPFMRKGDRSNFLKIKPNDTILIKENLINRIIKEINLFGSVGVFITMIFQFTN